MLNTEHRTLNTHARRSPGRLLARLTGLLCVAFCAALCTTSRAQEPTPDAEPGSAPKKKAVFEKLPNGDVRLGGITIHRKQNELSFPAHINMSSGAIDVVAATAVGRLYESLLRTETRPFHLQTMLYLLGARNGPRLLDINGKQGDLFDIDLEWRAPDDRVTREPVEAWLLDESTQEPMKRMGWVFVGSSIANGVFLADVEGNLCVSYSAGETVLDIPDVAGDKAWSFSVNDAKAEPGKDAPVRVIVVPRKKQP